MVDPVSFILGPFVPRTALKLLRRRLLPVVPVPAGLGLQFVHSDDVGDAVIRMMQRRARGSFNIAADVLDTRGVAALVGTRPIEVNPRLVRRLVVALSRARVIALTPGWFDVATNTPLMDTSKARDELGWAPTRSSTESALELIDGLADGAVGASAAMGANTKPDNSFRGITRRVHDAQLVGSCRETVNKVLTDFSQRHWIRMEGKSLLIADTGRFHRRAC